MDAQVRPTDTEAVELQRLFDLQRTLSRRGVAPSLAARLDALERLKTLLIANEAEIVRAISADFGTRGWVETSLLEVQTLLNGIRHVKAHLARWMKPERRGIDITFQPARASVRYEPLGVVGIIGTWNYPLYTCLGPLLEALGAGNRVLIKPSEVAPKLAALLRRLVGESYDSAEVAVVPGGVELAEAFCRLPFDHILFTGSTIVGRKVLQAAAANLTPVTLELGGKSPVVVCPDYPVEKAARSIVFGKFMNAGQTCIAPDYVLAPRDKVEAVARAVIDQARRAYPAIAGNDDYTSIITERHYGRLRKAIEEARGAGATVLTHEDEGAAANRKIGPTVVLGAPAHGLLMNEEIFGPILPILPYERLGDAVDHIVARDRPLALYCFSHDKRQSQWVLDRALSGGATLNGALLHATQDNLPFGGVGASGMGAYHGRDGFKRFSHARAVYEVGPVNLFEHLGPPWGGLATAASRLLRMRA